MKLVWATRGRSWGFRFLLDGGYSDPYPTYARVFAGSEGDVPVYRRVGDLVGLKFHDPLGRQDEAGRVIPHDIVVLPPAAEALHSVDDGVDAVWPHLARAFANLWDRPSPPTTAEIGRYLDDFS